MGSYRGNVPKIEADMDVILERLRKTTATITGLCKEYHVNYESLRRVLLKRITKRQYSNIVKKKKRQVRNCGQFRAGEASYVRPKGVRVSPATEFRKGHLPASHKHTGTINVRNDKCGKQFRWIKVSGIVQGKHKWIPYARHIWQQEHGPLPPGKFVVHVDGETMNDDPGNLRAVTRKEHLDLQMARDPKMLTKCCKNASKASRRRHSRNRRAKKRLESERAKQEERTVKQRALEARVEAEKRKLRPKVIRSRWECKGCGADYDKPKPPCPKCGYIAYEKIEQTIAATG